MKDLHIVPFSHLDLHGLGQREECLSRGGYILSRVFDLMERRPEFRFLVEQVVFAEDYLTRHPEWRGLFARLVKEGRIEVGPTWAGLPQNLQVGEDLVRNLLYGQRYLKEAFGVRGRTVCLTDLPGYTPQYPQIARGCGVEGAVWTRCGPEEGLFRWRGADGSEVIAWHAGAGALWEVVAGRSDVTRSRALGREVAQAAERGPAMMPWGEALTAPSEELYEKLLAWCGAQGVRPVVTTPRGFFDALSCGEALPALEGEVPSVRPSPEPLFPGVVPLNVAAVHRLTAAEKLVTTAHLLAGVDYPAERLREAWLRLLEAMEHNDGGTGGEETEARKARDQQAVLLWAEDLVRSATRAIAGRVALRAESPATDCLSVAALPVVVFNPTSWSRTDLVTAHLSFYGPEDPSEVLFDMYKIVDAEGRDVPFQDLSVQRISTTEVALAFIAEEVPPDGYAAFYLVPATMERGALLRIEAPGMMAPAGGAPEFVLRDVASAASVPYRGIRTGRTFSNDFYDLTVDEVTGRVSIRDRRLGRMALEGVCVKGAEESLDRGRFQYDLTGRVFEVSVKRVDLVESGEVRATVLIEGRLLGSPVEQRFTLYRGLDRIDVEVRLRWRDEQPVRVQTVFPTGIVSPRVFYGTPYGANAFERTMPGCGPGRGDEMDRETWGRQRECQGWVSADGDGWGVVIASDRRAWEVEGGTLRGDLLRSIPAEASQDYRLVWRTYPPEVSARYSLRSYAGDWRSARAWRDGWALNHPLISQGVNDNSTPRSLPARMSFFRIEGDILIPVFKRAEDGEGVVLRAFEPAGVAQEGALALCREMGEVCEANMLEEKVGGVEPGRVRFRPFEIKTIRIEEKT